MIQGAKRAYKNPISAAGICIAGVSTAIMLALVAAVSLLGFGNLSPIVGISNITAGSLFATLQSAGMGGAGAAMVQTLGAAIGIGGTLTIWKGQQQDEKDTRTTLGRD
ncbi:hypothetical protein F5Y11DRAFT_353214 [Daldinia sp. FL1419]|nr:hypothetical protein F5Y11DRAFT_353214 [Daldinia sp. FL1419]